MPATLPPISHRENIVQPATVKTHYGLFKYNNVLWNGNDFFGLVKSVTNKRHNTCGATTPVYTYLCFLHDKRTGKRREKFLFSMPQSRCCTYILKPTVMLVYLNKYTTCIQSLLLYNIRKFSLWRAHRVFHRHQWKWWQNFGPFSFCVYPCWQNSREFNFSRHTYRNTGTKKN